MSDSYRVYTAGIMKGLTFQQQMWWRDNAETIFNQYSDKKVEFLHPPLFYNYEYNYHKTESEVKEFELSKVASADVLIVNLHRINESVGTHFEIAHADSINHLTDKHIYIVGFGSKEGVHPWILDSMIRVEDSLESAVEYISEYLFV